MAVQSRADFNSKKFFLGRQGGVTKMKETIIQIGAHSCDLVQFTLMAQIAASEKWIPWTTVTAVDGTAYPTGIYTGDDIPEATIQAGDVTDRMILVFDMEFDEGMLVIENSLTLATVIATSDATNVYQKMTARLWLLGRKLMPRLTNSSTAQENT